jgi:hypothetical protein
MARYAWIIDEDRYEDEGTEFSAVGVTGPRGITEDQHNTLTHNKKYGKKFRMYDDDGAIVYVGRIINNGDDANYFGPLDDFGEPNTGCTEIWYQSDKDGRVWEQL